jgi:hypothetical protein
MFQVAGLSIAMGQAEEASSARPMLSPAVISKTVQPKRSSGLFLRRSQGVVLNRLYLLVRTSDHCFAMGQ